MKSRLPVTRIADVLSGESSEFTFTLRKDYARKLRALAKIKRKSWQSLVSKIVALEINRFESDEAMQIINRGKSGRK